MHSLFCRPACLLSWMILACVMALVGPASASESVAVIPHRIEVPPGSSMLFLAQTQGASPLQVRWSATGGTVAGLGPLGIYTAKQVVGIYQVTARIGTAGPTDSAQVKVGYAPVATPLSLATSIGQPVAVTLAGTDRDHDPLTATVLSNPGHGTLTGTVPNLTYTPQGNGIHVAHATGRMPSNSALFN